MGWLSKQDGRLQALHDRDVYIQAMAQAQAQAQTQTQTQIHEGKIGRAHV